MSNAKSVVDEIVNSAGFITIEVSVDELLAIIRLMKFANESFSFLAEEATKNGDAPMAIKNSDNAEVAKILYTKLSALAQIGQPNSSNLH